MNTIDYITLKICERLKVATALLYNTINTEQIMSTELIELIKLHIVELESLERGIVTPEIKKIYIDEVAKLYIDANNDFK